MQTASPDSVNAGNGGRGGGLVTDVTIAVAGVTARLRARQPGLALRVPSPHDRFLSTTPDPTFDIGITLAEPPPPPDGALLFVAERSWRLVADGDTLHLQFRLHPPDGRPAALSFNLDTGLGECTVAPPENDLADSTVDLFDSPLLQLLIYWKLAALGGVGLHASGVALDGHGCLFIGVSGAGKSTIGNLLLRAGAAALSDDRVGITGSPDGFTIHGTPWQGTPSLHRPASAPLRALFFLEQADLNEAEPLSPGIACAELIARACPPYFSHSLMATVTDTCSRITTTIPCYRLRFLPDDSVVHTVRQALVWDVR